MSAGKGCSYEQAVYHQSIYLENISTILCSIYLNDLHDFLIANTNHGIPFDCDSDLFIDIF